MSSAPLSQGAEADVTAEQATFRFVAAHSPLAPARERGFAIPTDAWTVVDPAQAHHRPFRDANWPPLLPRNTSFWSIVVDTLLVARSSDSVLHPWERVFSTCELNLNVNWCATDASQHEASLR